MSNSGGLNSNSHVALLPSAGMGHLTPFLRLAASLVRYNCRVTLITTHPTVSLAESRAISQFLTAFPQVAQKQFHLLPLDHASAEAPDPFFLQWETIRRSVHLLIPLLSSISLISAVVIDVTLLSSVIPITTNLGLPNYILFTSSAKMCSLVGSLSTIVESKTSSTGTVEFGDNVEIPGLPAIPTSLIPPALINLNSLFATIFLQNSQGIMKSNGVLINTFEGLETDTLDVFNTGKFIDGFPPLYPIGPFLPCEFEKSNHAPLKWLDDQPDGSVVFISFGSRTALSREQMKELGNGLVSSGCTFLWVTKDKKVDKEDGETLDNLLGHELMNKMKNQGLVIKDWVDQELILGHKAVGGFVNHGGWNSLVETAWHGVPVLVWPQSGDQKINADAVERSGLAMWVKDWGWGSEVVVKGEEVADRIKELMGNGLLRDQAKKIREEARKAVGVGGSSERTLIRLIDEWKKSRIV